MTALDQYKAELIEKLGREPTYAELSHATGISNITIRRAYDAKEVRIMLKIHAGIDYMKAPARLIRYTVGLPEREQLSLIVKTMDMGWSSDTAFKIKTALKEMEDSIRLKILEEKSRLPHKVITALIRLDGTPKTSKLLNIYIGVAPTYLWVAWHVEINLATSLILL